MSIADDDWGLGQPIDDWWPQEWEGWEDDDVTHRTLVNCDRCGAEGDPENGKPYPEGWSCIGIKVFTYNTAGMSINDRIDVDLCPMCTGHLQAYVHKRGRIAL